MYRSPDFFSTTELYYDLVSPESDCEGFTTALADGTLLYDTTRAVAIAVAAMTLYEAARKRASATTSSSSMTAVAPPTGTLPSGAGSLVGGRARAQRYHFISFP